MQLDLVYVLVGVAVPLLTSLIKQETWSTKVKQTLATGLALVGGTIATYLNSKNIDATTLVTAWAATAGVSQVVFAYILQQTGLDKVLTAVGAPKK